MTETDHFHVYRAGSLSFERIPVDAASKMPDDHMDSIEPFDYAELKPFSTAYLPGFLADKYDVSVEDSQERADRRCRETLENSPAGYGARLYVLCAHHEKYPSETGKSALCAASGVDAQHEMGRKGFPVCHERADGRLVGDLPISWGNVLERQQQQQHCP